MLCPRPIEGAVIDFWRGNKQGFPKVCAKCLLEGFDELFELAGLEPLIPRLNEIVDARLAKKYAGEAK
jgi:hypothetical protein